MAVSVDKVYQKVLAIANKEQRGYITPQEFNLFADQAQMEIFEQYFYDLSQFKRRRNSNSPHEYSDPINLIEEKLYQFKKVTTLANPSNLFDIQDFYMLSNVYALTENYQAAGGSYKDVGHYSETVDAEEVNHFDLIKTQSSPLTWATKERPIYYIRQNVIAMIPDHPVYGAYYIAKPAKPNWTYILSTSKNPLYNPNAQTQDFELHPSEEPKLVIKILQLAGVSMKDYNLAQIAGQKEAVTKQQEKQ